MDTLAKSDIFFFITAVAVIILTILAAIALVYGIKLMRDARQIMAEVKRQGEVLIEDMDDARAYLKREGLKIGAFVSLVSGFFKGKSRSRRIREGEEDPESSE